MKQIITIDEKTVEVDGKQYKLVEVTPERKEPTWAEVFNSGQYFVTSSGKVDMPFGKNHQSRVLTERVARKAATFMKIAMLAEYLCPGYVPDWTNPNTAKWGIKSSDGEIEVDYYTISARGTYIFNSHYTAQRAVDIFRANGDEQELIDFLTK